MTLKRSKNIDELCYPFIYESSPLCDFEIATDELCNHIGGIMALLPSTLTDVAADLDKLQPMIYHLNGSIRGKLAIDEQDIQWLLSRYHHYQLLTRDRIDGFVLPRGPAPVPQLHLARSAAKKAIRLMVKLDDEGVIVADILHRFCNLLCNFCFVLTLHINKLSDVKETPFISKSYSTRAQN